MGPREWAALAALAGLTVAVVYLATRPAPAAQAPPVQYLPAPQAPPGPGQRSQTTTAQDVASIVGAVVGVLRSSAGGKS